MHKLAKLTAPCYSAEAHGTVGAVVYRNWRGAAIASVKAAPHSSHTGPISDRLQHLVDGARSWRGFSIRQRWWWSMYAQAHRSHCLSAVSKQASGFNWFCSCFVHLRLVGHPPRIPPPDRPCLAALSEITPAQNGTEIHLEYEYSTLPDPGILSIEVYRAGPFTRGRNARRKDALRTVHGLVDTDIDVPTIGTPGSYTLFARLVDRQGLVSPWLRNTIDME